MPAVISWVRVLQPFSDDIKHLLNNLYCFIEHHFKGFCQWIYASGNWGKCQESLSVSWKKQHIKPSMNSPFWRLPLKLMLCCTFCTFGRGQKQAACWEAVPDTNTRQGVWSLTWTWNLPDFGTACFTAHISEEWTHQTMWRLDFSNGVDILETQITVGWKWPMKQYLLTYAQPKTNRQTNHSPLWGTSAAKPHGHCRTHLQDASPINPQVQGSKSTLRKTLYLFDLRGPAGLSMVWPVDGANQWLLPLQTMEGVWSRGKPFSSAALPTLFFHWSNPSCLTSGHCFSSSTYTHQWWANASGLAHPSAIIYCGCAGKTAPLGSRACPALRLWPLRTAADSPLIHISVFLWTCSVVLRVASRDYLSRDFSVESEASWRKSENERIYCCFGLFWLGCSVILDIFMERWFFFLWGAQEQVKNWAVVFFVWLTKLWQLPFLGLKTRGVPLICSLDLYSLLFKSRY